MGSFSNYLENATMGYLFNGAALSQPVTWVSLFTTDPTESGSGTEVSTTATGYNRIRSTGWTAASSGYIYNSTVVQYSTATGSWGTIQYFAVHDSSTAGNMLAYSSLTTSKTVAVGDSVAFSTGAISIQLD
jgi:hypothetical protein